MSQNRNYYNVSREHIIMMSWYYEWTLLDMITVYIHGLTRLYTHMVQDNVRTTTRQLSVSKINFHLMNIIIQHKPHRDDYLWLRLWVYAYSATIIVHTLNGSIHSHTKQLARSQARESVYTQSISYGTIKIIYCILLSKFHCWTIPTLLWTK